MATKLSNSHIDTIIEKSKSYNILDTYIVLSHISSEVNGKFLIQTYGDNKSDLIAQLKRYMSNSYKTLYNNLNELIELNILNYNEELSSWMLVDMENMVKKKEGLSVSESANFKGYTKIREFFLSDIFHTMKSTEKRCVVYLAKLFDSKASSSYDGFIMNLIKPNSKWFSVIRTKSKYYAKYIVEKMLSKYSNIFTNQSEELRENDFAPKRISNFKFSFKCDPIEKKDKEDMQYNLIKACNEREFKLVSSRIAFAKVTLSKTQVMHIVRGISTIKEWSQKERVTQIIVNKYRAIQIHKSREEIKSLQAYLVAVIRSVMEEFTTFKSTFNLTTTDASLDYLESIGSFNYDMNSEINTILSTI
ncbi:MAG: hypothetical protein ACRC7N_10515 [Clostridium sp.]